VAILLVLVFGFFMIVPDTAIVNIAIPSISTDLNPSLDQILWVINALMRWSSPPDGAPRCLGADQMIVH